MLSFLPMPLFPPLRHPNGCDGGVVTKVACLTLSVFVRLISYLLLRFCVPWRALHPGAYTHCLAYLGGTTLVLIM